MSTKLYTTVDVAEFCGVSHKTVFRWVTDKEIKAARLPKSRQLRFYAEDVRKFMRKHGFQIPPELKESTT